MENLHFVEAVTPEQLMLMSRLHAMGWRTAYRGMIPSEYLDHHIQEDGWVERFQRRYAAGEARGLLLYRGEKPEACWSLARTAWTAPAGGRSTRFTPTRRRRERATARW